MKEQHKYFCLSVIILLSFILLGVLELKPGWARSVIKTIDVGGEPIDLEYNPSNKYMYVANFDSDDVSVIASVTNIVIKTIDIGTGPWDLEYNPSNKRIYSANHWSDTVSVIGSSTIIIGQAPNAGLDLKVESGTIVQLDGDSSTSSNSSEATLTYKWTQTEGLGVTLNHPFSPNPTFIAPIMVDQSEITFSLVVTNEEGITSEPDEVKITVYPTRSTISEEDNSKTINDAIKGIIKNPLNVSNSIDSANKIRDILSDRQ